MGRIGGPAEAKDQRLIQEPPVARCRSERQSEGVIPPEEVEPGLRKAGVAVILDFPRLAEPSEHIASSAEFRRDRIWVLKVRGQLRWSADV